MTQFAMNIKVIKLIAVIIAVVFSAISIRSFQVLKAEKEKLANNQIALLDTIQRCKIADSLNAAKVKVLQFSLSEYKKYRAEDAELIKELKLGKHVSTVSTSTKTVSNIKTKVRDSIIYKDKLIPIDTLKQINYDSKWISVFGTLYNDSIDLRITNREELLVVESLVKKKFLFIKLPVWLFGYKTKAINVVSKNPNTVITNLEFIQTYDK